MKERMKIIGTIEWESYQKAEKRIHIIWNDPELFRNQSDSYWKIHKTHIQYLLRSMGNNRKIMNRLEDI
jgi:hypothetical protein